MKHIKNLRDSKDIVNIEKFFYPGGSYLIKTTYQPYEIKFDIQSNTYIKTPIKLR